MAVKTKQLLGQLKYFKQIQHRDNKYEQNITTSIPAMYPQTPARSLSFSNILILMTNILYIITIASVGMSWWKALRNKQVQVAVCITPVAAVWPLNCKVIGNINCQRFSIKYLPDKRSRELDNLTSCLHLFSVTQLPLGKWGPAPFRTTQVTDTGSNTSVSPKLLSSEERSIPDF